MKKKMKPMMRTAMAAFAVAAMVSLNALTVFAATAKISFSDPSVMVGSEVNVTMKISSTDDAALDNVDIMLAYDPNALEFISGTNAEGGAGSIKVKGSAAEANTKLLSYTLKFKALGAGNSQITVSTQEIYDAESQPFTLSKQGNSTVKIVPLATFSQDATLSALKISPGTLSPAFSPEVTAYTASVGGDTERVAVSAGTASANAKVVISGNENLKLGENVINCKVTAEDGQTVKEYTIAVTKTEGVVETGASDAAAQIGDMKAVIDGVEYGIAAAFDPSALPVGFDSTEYIYKDAKVAAGRPAEGNQILLYLESAEGKSGFYFYEEASDSFTPCVKVDTTANSVTVIPLDEGVQIPEGFAESKIEIEGQQVRGWVWTSETDPEYCVFYGMNSKGEKDFYRYDLTEKTMQRYFIDPSVDTGVSKDQYVAVADLYNSLRIDYGRVKLALIGLSAICLILLAVTVLLLMKKSKAPKKTEVPEQEDDVQEEPVKPVITFKDRREESYLTDDDYENEEFEDDYTDDYEEEEIEETEDDTVDDVDDEDDDFEFLSVEEDLDELEAKLDSSPKQTSADADDDFEFLDLN